jgi:hypothetical protein
MAPRKIPPLERLRARTIWGDCWTTDLKADRGYARITVEGRRREFIHVFSYKLYVGPIPAGMTVDHKCFNPGCWRPDHLQLLTRSENAKRCRRAMATHCKRGHSYTDHRRNGSRECLVCRREKAKLWQREFRKRQRVARLAA